jgi:hypothetical protein
MTQRTYGAGHYLSTMLQLAPLPSRRPTAPASARAPQG